MQVLATLYVSYKILKTAEENYQELSQHREEHQQVNWDDPGMAILRLCKDQDKRYAYVYIYIYVYKIVLLAAQILSFRERYLVQI